MTKNIFLLDQHDNHEKHTLLTSFDDKDTAEQLIKDGKAVEIDLGMYTTYADRASQIHGKYNNDVARIKDTDERLKNEGEKEYEIEQLDKEYAEANEEIKKEYAEYRQQAIENARTTVASATLDITENDRQLAEQFSDRATLTLAMASESERSVALKRIADDIGLLSDNQRAALQGKVVGLLSSVENELDKRVIYDAVSDVRSQDLLSLKIAQQLPHNPTISYDIERVVKSALKGGK